MDPLPLRPPGGRSCRCAPPAPFRPRSGFRRVIPHASFLLLFREGQGRPRGPCGAGNGRTRAFFGAPLEEHEDRQVEERRCHQKLDEAVRGDEPICVEGADLFRAESEVVEGHEQEGCVEPQVGEVRQHEQHARGNREEQEIPARSLQPRPASVLPHPPETVSVRKRTSSSTALPRPALSPARRSWRAEAAGCWARLASRGLPGTATSRPLTLTRASRGECVASVIESCSHGYLHPSGNCRRWRAEHEGQRDSVLDDEPAAGRARRPELVA